jgi:Bacterial PH domain
VNEFSSRIRVTPCSTGEHWQLHRQSRLLAAAFVATAALFGCIAFAALSSHPQTQSEHDVFVGAGMGAIALAALAVGLAVGLARSGLWLDADGLTCRGLLLRRRLLWSDVAAFASGVEEHLPSRPAAIALVKLRDGRYVALPGTRVEGLRWNLDEHKLLTASIAAALEERRAQRDLR